MELRMPVRTARQRFPTQGISIYLGGSVNIFWSGIGFTHRILAMLRSSPLTWLLFQMTFFDFYTSNN